MSRSLNKAMLIGNLGSDPEIRSVGSGTRVASFSIATSENWQGRDGQQQEKTQWHRITVWGNPNQPDGGLVGVVERFLKKGERVFVEGQIEYRQYEDKEGVTKYATDIVVRPFNGTLMLLGGRESGGAGYDAGEAPRREPARSGGGRAAGPAAKKSEADYDDFPKLDDDDDLPF